MNHIDGTSQERAQEVAVLRKRLKDIQRIAQEMESIRVQNQYPDEVVQAYHRMMDDIAATRLCPIQVV